MKNGIIDGLKDAVRIARSHACKHDWSEIEKTDFEEVHECKSCGAVRYRATGEDEVELASEGEELEACVLCDEETMIPVGMPVEHRMFYEPGQGQLCRRCWLELQELSK